jgi:nucleotide-binding universal stress UspA family protein
MAMFNKILAAVDGSESSLVALREACRLGRSEKARLVVVAVAPRYEGDLGLVGVKNIQALIVEPWGKAFAESEKIALAEGVRIETVFEVGEPHERIVATADVEECDLIILGAGRLGALWRMVLGSVGARVIAESAQNVLVVPRGTKMGYDRILLALAASQTNTAAGDMALNFARSYGAQLIIASVLDTHSRGRWKSPGTAEDLFQKARESAARLQGQADVLHVRSESVELQGKSAQSITELAKQQDAGMIVLDDSWGTQSKLFVMPGAIEQVIRSAPCPVLVVRATR